MGLVTWEAAEGMHVRGSWEPTAILMFVSLLSGVSEVSRVLGMTSSVKLTSSHVLNETWEGLKLVQQSALLATGALSPLVVMGLSKSASLRRASYS